MKKLNKLALGIALSTVSAFSQAGTIITNWGYINEAGFANATTGYAKEVQTVNGAKNSFLDPNTLQPLDSTGAASPTNGNNWALNYEDGLVYDLGTAGYVSGSSNVSDSSTGLSIFEEPTVNNPAGIPSGALYDEICWGKGPSCLSFKDGNGADVSRLEGTATVNANGGTNWNTGTTMSHKNKITGSPSLTSIDLIDGLKLFSNEVVGGQLPLIELGFDIIFNETYDAPELFDYAPDDAFIVSIPAEFNSLVTFGADYIDITLGLDLTGAVAAGYHTDYEVVTRISGLEVVSVSNNQAFGLITPEGGTNLLNAAFAIRAVGVPEPVSIAIFGLGLLGLAGASRRKA
ncbi:PEP-CTERM sorting domain-containing protein [Catenovulum maritimum]|jgi:hypothetical protein|uniref:Ice-binding protein C-terminal domain-containing protein n=1 Tax=Catenovulum maritimum TaxID=1513271 RepID=A0A0J8GTI9_9ALTE|nr:PEP-CTERM sorting domain-containing protein [Catenovulum maritimum]KMT64629.1 hypothetical protein XM47_13380 [Catenovulum maritimum]